MPRSRWLGGAVLFLASAGLAYALVLNLCAAVFSCGCRSWWTGAAAHCNVHLAGVRHCPWCAYGPAGFRLAMILMLSPQLLLSFWPTRLRWPLRAAIVFGLFPLSGVAVAIGYGVWSGYWR